MDKPSPIVPLLEPEWLSKQPNTGIHSQAESLVGLPLSSRSHYSLSPGSPQSPRILGRSKSQPLLLENDGHKVNDVFTMLKERSTFDRNFPTISAKKPTKVTQPQKDVKETVWKQGNHEAVKVTPNNNGSSKGATPLSKAIPIPIAHSVSEEDNQRSRGHVQTSPPVSLHIPQTSLPSPPKILNNKVVPSKKKDTASKKPRPFDMSLLRKASSEPALPIREDYVEKYAKMMALKKAREEKDKSKIVEEKAKPISTEEKSKVALDRDDFFQGLIKKEEEKMRNDVKSETLDPPQSESIPTMHTQSTAFQEPVSDTRRKKSSSFTIEDEEKFLRNLGWVPEEEENIPELTPEEIVQVKTQTSGPTKDKKVSLDPSVKRWQHDKFARTVQTVL